MSKAPKGPIIKTEQEIAYIREAGKRLAHVVATVSEKIAPGVSTKELDNFAYNMITDMGDVPAFLNYRPEGHSKGFPGTLCVSINDEVVHGVPHKDMILQEGDIISIDCGVKHNGCFADHAVTVSVGEIKNNLKELLSITKESMLVGINEAMAGNTTGDIGFAIENYIKSAARSISKNKKLGIVRSLGGHGVGRYIHEDPFVMNYGTPGRGVELKEGMIIAIEPMVTLGSEDIDVLDDGYTLVTADGTPAAHFEHTVLITSEGPEILTKVA